MPSREVLERKIRSAEKLRSVVKTMKMLAMVNVQHYDRAVVALAQNFHTVELGFQVLLRSGLADGVVSRERPNARLGAIVFGSDQGMCGPLNEQIVRHALEDMEASQSPPSDRHLLVAGERAAERLARSRAGILEEVLALPGGVPGIARLVQQALLLVEAWIFEREVGRVVLYYSRRVSGAFSEPHTANLLPLDRKWLGALRSRRWHSRALPTFTMDPQALFSALLRQYLFVSLYRGFAESLASENASRLASMEGAERNIEDLLERLQAEFRLRNQMQVTEELLDIMSGYEAAAGRASPALKPRET